MAQLIRKNYRRSHGSRGKARLALVAGVVTAGALALAAVAALGGFRGGVVIERESVPATAPAVTAETLSAASPPESVVASVFVHIDGAVVAPGVYELTGAHPRVNDAVMAAGGLAGDADTTALNLAAALSDGEKVHVPRQGEAMASVQTSLGLASGSDGGASSSGVININTATAEELDSLPGIGPSTAAAIVEDRERNGPFASPEDLMRVSGIGEGKFSKLKDQIRV